MRGSIRIGADRFRQGVDGACRTDALVRRDETQCTKRTIITGQGTDDRHHVGRQPVGRGLVASRSGQVQSAFDPFIEASHDPLHPERGSTSSNPLDEGLWIT